MEDNIGNIIIVLLFILIPVITAIARGVKGALDRAREEQKRRERRLGPRPQTPAKELQDFLRPRPALPVEPPPTPATREGERTFFEEVKEFLGVPGEVRKPPRAKRPAPPPKKAAPPRPEKPRESVEEHMESAWGGGPKPTGVDREALRFRSVVEEHRGEVESHLQWDDVHGGKPAKSARAPRGEAPIPSWSRGDLRRGVLLAEILAPPMALRRSGEGPLAPLFSAGDPESPIQV